MSIGQFFRAWSHTLVAGTAIGAISVTFSVSLAAIIFTGAYAGDLPSGIAISLFSATILGAVLAVSSSYPGTIAGPQDKVASILAVMAASIAGSLPAGGPTLFPTLLTCLALTTGSTALALFLLGAFRLGNTVRFLPYAVVGGFLAGTGWLLVKGAFAMMTGAPLDPWNLSWLLAPDALALWMPGFAFALLLTGLTRRRDEAVVVPLAAVAGVLAIYLWVFISGTSLESARSMHLILPAPPENLAIPWLTSDILHQVDWNVVLSQLPLIGAVVIVSALSLLLYASGLEVGAKTDIDLNQELKSTGIANVLCMPAGGIAGFNILSDTLLGARMGAANRVTGLVAAGVSAAALVAGASLVSYLPIAVLGGLILYLGFSFIMEWLYDARRTLPRNEYLLLLLMFAVVVTLGFLFAVLLGIIAAVLMFAATYSRINVVRYAVSGEDFRSSVARTEDELGRLRELGNRILILRLQGFIFFGTAYALTSYVRHSADARDRAMPAYLILDFQSVTGFDHSTLVSLTRMRQLAEANGVRLVFAGLDPEFRERLSVNGFQEDEAAVRFERDLDHGIEWAENRLLEDAGAQPEHPGAFSLREWLQDEFGDALLVEQLFDHLENVRFQDGDALIRQGAADTDIYFVERGQVLTLLTLPDGRDTRLRHSGPGTIVGDMTYYLGGSRSASVIAEGDCAAYRLSSERVEHIERQQPELALNLHKLLARCIARRLVDSNRTLQQVLQ